MTKRAVVRRPRISGRRLIAVAALGLLAAGALSACRSEPGTAAFIGDTRITDAHVDTIAAAAPSSTPDAKSETVAAVVFNEIAAQYAKEKGYPTPTVTDDLLSEVATQNDASLADARADAYVETRALAQAWIKDLTDKAAPVTPSDSELMKIYAEAVSAQAAQPNDFASFKTALLGYPAITQIFGLEQELTSASARYDVSISPRYAQTCAVAPCAAISYPLLALQTQQSGAFTVAAIPLGGADKSPDVIDIPNPVQPAPAQPLQVPGPPPPGS